MQGRYWPGSALNSPAVQRGGLVLSSPGRKADVGLSRQPTCVITILKYLAHHGHAVGLTIWKPGYSVHSISSLSLSTHPSRCST